MNRLLLQENQLMDFDLIARKSVQDYFDTNYMIYFLLEGEASFFVVRFILSREMLSKYYDVQIRNFGYSSRRRFGCRTDQ